MPLLPQTRLKKTFYHQTFEVKDDGRTKYRHTLLVNPQEMSITEPARINPQQTLGGAYVSYFGQGLHQVSISGVTGYHARHNAEGEVKDGFTEMQDFRRNIYRDFLKNPSSQLEMFWYNWEDEEYYKIVPLSFRLMRNKAEPILYRYEFTFVCLEPVGSGKVPKYTEKTLDKINLTDLGDNLVKSISGSSEVMSIFRLKLK